MAFLGKNHPLLLRPFVRSLRARACRFDPRPLLFSHGEVTISVSGRRHRAGSNFEAGTKGFFEAGFKVDHNLSLTIFNVVS